MEGEASQSPFVVLFVCLLCLFVCLLCLLGKVRLSSSKVCDDIMNMVSAKRRIKVKQNLKFLFILRIFWNEKLTVRMKSSVDVVSAYSKLHFSGGATDTSLLFYSTFQFIYCSTGQFHGF